MGRARPSFHHHQNPHSYIRHQQQREASYNAENYTVPSVIKDKQFDHFDEITNKTNNIVNNINDVDVIVDDNWAYINEKIDYKFVFGCFFVLVFF